MTYQRNGQFNSHGKQAAPSQERSPKSTAPQEEGGVRVNGIQQVLDMLAVADAPFRNSLLKRIAAENPKLAAELRARLFV